MAHVRRRVAEENRDDDNDSGKNISAYGSDMEISDTQSETETEVGSDEDGNHMEERERTLQNQITAMQASIDRARAHVCAYQIQRDETKQIINFAKLDNTHLLPSLCHCRVLTIDMGQNLNLPIFEGGGSQEIRII